MGSQTTFQVEHAGCESCAALVRDVLEEVVQVVDVTIDEAADLATVRLGSGASPSVEEVDRLLHEASHVAGHAYRVKPGSWHTAPE